MGLFFKIDLYRLNQWDAGTSTLTHPFPQGGSL